YCSYRVVFFFNGDADHRDPKKGCRRQRQWCIRDRLYVIPRSRRLKGVIQFPRPAYELALHCIDELSWRRKEEDSLAKIVSDVLKKNETLSFKLLGCKMFSEENLNFDNVAKHLYAIRNQFVHQLEAKREKVVSDDDIIDAIEIIADIVISAYELYDADIIEWQCN
ncbi:hypothetical protein, partial [Escherichia coli]|uniref:hypothetical protein n=1 Tax=Escherichia coli TaxID=562 RepID=UPI00384B6182